MLFPVNLALLIFLYQLIRQSFSRNGAALVDVERVKLLLIKIETIQRY